MEAVTILLDDILADGQCNEWLMEKFESSPATYPIAYRILGATLTTLTNNTWTIGIDEEIKEKPFTSALFLSCKTLFDFYIGNMNDYEAFENYSANQENGLWLECRATDLYETGHSIEMVESAFKALDQVGAFTSKKKREELENEELNSTVSGDNENGPYTSRVLAWLRIVNGVEGGNGWGDHALVFKFQLKRISLDYYGGIHEQELIPIYQSCRYLNSPSEPCRKKRKP